MRTAASNVAPSTGSPASARRSSSTSAADRVRNLAETLALEQLTRRNLLHRFENVPGVDRPVTVPVAAFRFADGGPAVDTPPQALGADTDAVLEELGLSAAEIAALRDAHVV